MNPFQNIKYIREIIEATNSKRVKRKKLHQLFYLLTCKGFSLHQQFTNRSGGIESTTLNYDLEYAVGLGYLNKSNGVSPREYFLGKQESKLLKEASALPEEAIALAQELDNYSYETLDTLSTLLFLSYNHISFNSVKETAIRLRPHIQQHTPEAQKLKKKYFLDRKRRS